MVGVFERVFEVGPVFRAEPHDTVRHLAEYVSLDAELGFITDHHDVMAVLATAVCRACLRPFATVPTSPVNSPRSSCPRSPEVIPQLHFADALALVGRGRRTSPTWRPRTNAALGEWALAEHGCDFLFVTGYPMVKRPFYTHPQPDDPRWSNSFDLLFRGLELVTGGQRLHRYEDYLAAHRRARRGPEPPSRAIWRRSRTGCLRTAGSPSGWNVSSRDSTGAGNIRETTLFPGTCTG